MTDFCIAAVTDAARRTIAEHETLVLSGRDRAVVFDTLINPPAPSERLQRAFAERNRRVLRRMAKRISADLRIVLLRDGYDWGGYTCGVENLDRYLNTQAGQDVRRKASAVFVLSREDEPALALGYDMLCAMAIFQGDVPAHNCVSGWRTRRDSNP